MRSTMTCGARCTTRLGRGARIESLTGEIVIRLVFGIPSDLSWRVEQRHGASTHIAPERSSTMGTRVIALLAIVGGVGWAIWPNSAGPRRAGMAGWGTGFVAPVLQRRIRHVGAGRCDHRPCLRFPGPDPRGSGAHRIARSGDGSIQRPGGIRRDRRPSPGVSGPGLGSGSGRSPWPLAVQGTRRRGCHVRDPDRGDLREPGVV